MRARGRPRGFEPQEALDTAMRVFWARGYDGASIDRLSRAMKMPRASLYHLFGDKEGLFLAAIARYAETRIASVVAAIGPRHRLADDLRAFFAAVVDLATSEPEAPGCLVSCVLADAAGANPAFRAELDQRFRALEKRIASRLETGIDELEAGADTEVLAIMLASVSRGIMLRARAGSGRAELHAVGAATVDLICRVQRHRVSSQTA